MVQINIDKVVPEPSFLQGSEGDPFFYQNGNRQFFIMKNNLYVLLRFLSNFILSQLMCHKLFFLKQWKNHNWEKVMVHSGPETGSSPLFNRSENKTRSALGSR